MSEESPRQLVSFFTSFPLEHFSKGDILLSPQEKTTAVFYLTQGSVVKYDISQTGNEIVVQTYQAGEYLPISSLLKETETNYYYQAQTDISAHVAPIKNIAKFMKKDLSITHDILESLLENFYETERRLAHAMGGTAYSRLLFELSTIVKKQNNLLSSNNIAINCSITDLAKRTGMSRETASRTMSKIKNDGLVTIKASKVTVTNAKKLEGALDNQL